MESLEVSESLCVFPAALLDPRGARSQSLLFDSGTKDPERLMEACPTAFLMACSWPGDTHSFRVGRGGPGVWVLAQELGIGGSLPGVSEERSEKLRPADLGRRRSC